MKVITRQLLEYFGLSVNLMTSILRTKTCVITLFASLIFSQLGCAPEKTSADGFLELTTESMWRRYFSHSQDAFGRNIKWVESTSDTDSHLHITIPKGEHYGTSLRYRFNKQEGEEPEELYLSYELKFEENWNPKRGGKLPGFSGTYSKAGWGGRPSDGYNGWSARGEFTPTKNGTNIGYYVYHSDMPGRTGDSFHFRDNEEQIELKNGVWNKILLYIKLNQPNHKNGVLEAWVNGKKVFRKSDFMFRKTQKLRIDAVWLNVYMGGRWVDETENSLSIRRMLISQSGISP